VFVAKADDRVSPVDLNSFCGRVSLILHLAVSGQARKLGYRESFLRLLQWTLWWTPWAAILRNGLQQDVPAFG
jgi:hypothetical protein